MLRHARIVVSLQKLHQRVPPMANTVNVHALLKHERKIEHAIIQSDSEVTKHHLNISKQY